jgi:hypothetical protein
LAIGVRAYFKLGGPIAMFDTEQGSGYVSQKVRRETGRPLMGERKRSFKDLVAFARSAEREGAAVVLVDSVTHPWRELCDSFLAQVNEKRKERRLGSLQKLEFQHWAAVKGMWAEFADWYLTAPMHAIIAGRAGHEYDMEVNDETQRKELVKTGIKMKVEGEFGFEPSLLVEMERIQEPTPDGGWRIRRKATVLGDRFGLIDGKSCEDPTFDFFLPHVAALVPSAHEAVDTAGRTETGADVEGNVEWQREKKEREILCEEIQGEIVAMYPGQTAAEKKEKADLLERLFETRSWTKVEGYDSGKLRAGLHTLRDIRLSKQDAAQRPAP